MKLRLSILSVLFLGLAPRAMAGNLARCVNAVLAHEAVTQPTGNVVVGFTRENGEIRPIHAATNEIHSIRVFDGIFSFLGGWNPERRIEELPLQVAPHVRATLAVADQAAYSGLPAEIQNLLNKGRILTTKKSGRTSAPTKYSVLMPVATGDPLQGRTGLLMIAGQPASAIANGRKYLVEIKGIGAPDGGFHYGWHGQRGPIRGGATGKEIEHELTIAKLLCRDGESDVIPIAGAFFDSPDGRQGYLIRLVSSNVRGSYMLPGLPQSPSHVESLSYAFGRLWGNAYSEGLVPISHLENVVVSDRFTRFAMTDFGDIHFIGSFPTEQVEAHEAALTSLSYIKELQGYSEMKHFPDVRKGLAEALAAKYPEAAKEVLQHPNPNEVADVVWNRVLRPAQYLQRKESGFVPAWFEYAQFMKPEALAKEDFLLSVPERLRQSHARLEREIHTLDRVIAEIDLEMTTIRSELAELSTDELSRERWLSDWRLQHSQIQQHAEAELKSYIERNAERLNTSIPEWRADRADVRNNFYLTNSRAIEATGFDAKKAWEFLRAEKQKQVGPKVPSHVAEIQEAFGAGVFIPIRIKGYLTGEVTQLSGLLPFVSPEERAFVQRNIEIARNRIKQLDGMDPWTFQNKMREDPDYWMVQSMLPYFSMKFAPKPQDADKDLFKTFVPILERLRREGKI